MSVGAILSHHRQDDGPCPHASVPPLPSSPPLPWPAQPGDLPRDLPNRDALEQLLAATFPEAEGPLSPIQGGRRAAAAQLQQLEPKRYGRSRNHLDGAVTRLSPWIRHGVLSLAEVRDAVFLQLQKRGQSRDDGAKLINELGWRDFWQRMWQALGDRIHDSQEELKTGHDPASYRVELPEDIRDGRTGLACIDAFRAELVHSGWLHNHARMWLAAYVVHWRRVHWKAGADWFLEHLLDGDPASNHLSWQWVASSFSHKPYFFNRDNLERYSNGRFCRDCASAAQCPFDGSYEQLEQQLFAAPRSVRAVTARRRR
ncbi:probable deoxyribodipyrimidine photolyase [Synechococcus sp. RS9917]|nr:probable deoxyribodipyrimidine photolyase [Synechococcus sp. RS9917]